MSEAITWLTIFVLAAFVGIEVISKVSSTLHTPLMSGANAIHGVILLGAAPLYLVRPSRPPAEIRSVEHVQREDASAVGGRQR